MAHENSEPESELGKPDERATLIALSAQREHHALLAQNESTPPDVLRHIWSTSRDIPGIQAQLLANSNLPDDVFWAGVVQDNPTNREQFADLGRARGMQISKPGPRLLRRLRSLFTPEPNRNEAGLERW